MACEASNARVPTHSLALSVVPSVGARGVDARPLDHRVITSRFWEAEPSVSTRFESARVPPSARVSPRSNNRPPTFPPGVPSRIRAGDGGSVRETERVTAQP